MKMGKYEFRVPQKAAVRKGEKFLILKRAPDAHVYPNCWDFPGGKIKEGENPEEALKREVKEETGLDVKIGKPEFVFSEKGKDHFIRYTVVFSAETVEEDKITLSKEHTEFKWATKEEILELKTENFLKAYLERRK